MWDRQGEVVYLFYQPHLSPDTQPCSHRSSSRNSRNGRGHGSIQMQRHRHPGNLRAGPALIPVMPTGPTRAGSSGSKMYSCLFGEVSQWAHNAPVEPITIVGRESEGGSCLFPPSSSELQAGVAAPPCLGAPWARENSRTPQPL